MIIKRIGYTIKNNLICTSLSSSHNYYRKSSSPICKSDYTLNGSICQKSFIYEQNSKDPDYNCLDDYTLKDKLCNKN